MTLYSLTGKLHGDDEIRGFYEDDITNLEVEDRDAITFESWLREYLLHGVFYEEDLPKLSPGASAELQDRQDGTAHRSGR